MKVRWDRIIGITLLAVFVYMFYKLQPLLKDILTVVNEPYGYNAPIKGIMLGVLCLSFVVGIKLIIRK